MDLAVNAGRNHQRDEEMSKWTKGGIERRKWTEGRMVGLMGKVGKNKWTEQRVYRTKGRGKSGQMK